MPVIRAFIAIEIPPHIHIKLEKVLKDIQSQIKTRDIHWVASKNIHLTLTFLGEVSTSNLEQVTKVLDREAIKHPQFEIAIGGLGAFPTFHRPRVVWVGIDAPPVLKALQKGIENEVFHLGYAEEEREFSPHLTLARISHTMPPDEIHRLSEILTNYRVGSLGTCSVNSVKLFKSDLLPGGAVYTPLFTAALKLDNPTA